MECTTKRMVIRTLKKTDYPAFERCGYVRMDTREMPVHVTLLSV